MAVSSPAPSSATSPGFAVPTTRRDEPCILALAFDSQLLAQQALHAALGLQDDEILDVHDAVGLYGARSGAEIVATTDPTPVAAAVPATLVGALVGTLVAGPLGLLVGGVLAGGSGALAAKLADTGIPSHVLEKLRRTVAPGQHVLVLLVSERRAGALAEFAMRCSTVGRSTILPC